MKKADPNPKANRNILKLVYVIVALFLGLIAYMAYFLQVRGEDVINNSYNLSLIHILRPGRALLSEFGDGKSEYLFDVPLHRKRVYDMMGGIRPGGACPAKFEDRTGRIR